MAERNLDELLKEKLTPEELKEYNRIQYGIDEHCEISLKDSTEITRLINNFDVKAYKFTAAKEELRKPRTVKIGVIQHSIVLPTDRSIDEQRISIFEKVRKLLQIAADEGVKIVCLQETWSMPFFLCTKEKDRWSEFAESATEGPSTRFLSKIAAKNKMVIISPILEIDDGKWWNSAVIINEKGEVMGKHHKNHLPSIGGFSETAFYAPGNIGHPVFDTIYGKIGVNICYGRHQSLNWLMLAINGAEIVFNPAATVAEFGESFWGIEARNAAIANNYFTCGINRVGKETFLTEDGREVSRAYYGSSYITAPNGSRTPRLSKVKDGLLITEVDLNLNRQVKDQWGFQMTARLDLYANEIRDAVEGNH